MTNHTGIVSGSVLLSDALYYPIYLEYSASTNNPYDLGLEFLQLSGHFSATECRVRPSLIFKAVASSSSFVSVLPARTCCAVSKLQSLDSHISIATAGFVKVFSISLMDAFGNVVPTCNEDVSVIHSGGPAQSRVDCLKSTAEFTPTSSGVYLVYSKLKSSATCEIPGAKMIVKPFFRNFQESSIRGTALTLSTCGVPSWMTMTIRDMFRNPQPKSESPLIRCALNGTFAIQTYASPCPGLNCPESIESDLGLRQYLKPDYVFNFVATLAGYFKLSIYSRDFAHVSGSPFSIRILPSAACASASTSLGSSLSVVTNQNMVSFVISSRDSFGNVQADCTWVSVVESDAGKHSSVAQPVLGGDFRATNQANCGIRRFNIFSMLLKKNSIFAT